VSLSEVERNKATIRELTEVIWNRAELDRLGDYYSEEFTSDYAPYAPARKGLAGIRAMVEGAHRVYTDYREEILDMLGEGDRVMVRLMLTGTVRSDWGGVPAVGKRVAHQEVVVITFRDGKIVHQKGLVDNLHALRQLGIVPTPKME
jgi:steroid delta-isomerase-like uncharacterized protein